MLYTFIKVQPIAYNLLYINRSLHNLNFCIFFSHFFILFTFVCCYSTLSYKSNPPQPPLHSPADTFPARAGHTQPHIDLPTLLLPMFLFKLLAPLLLYIGCNPYFPAVKSISFLCRHLKFHCHLPVKCSQVQIGIKCIYRLLRNFPDSSLHLLLSLFIEY